MSIKNEIWELRLDALVKGVDDAFRNFRRFPSSDNPTYRHILKAAVSRCIDYNLILCNLTSTETCGFLMPALRSMCEDLIIVSFLKGVDETVADRVIGCALACELTEKLQTQHAFFVRYRSHQLVPSQHYVETTISDPRSELRKAWKDCGCELRNDFDITPTAWQLAKKVDMASFYSYFYNFSSATVHFSSHQLLRSGWGPKDETSRFSAEYLSGYFYVLCRVYGAILLTHFLLGFDEKLTFGDDLRKSRNELRDFLDSITNWPEIVTFEELNLERPDNLHPMLAATLRYRVSELLW